jgi:hypothetical protein
MYINLQGSEMNKLKVAVWVAAMAVAYTGFIDSVHAESSVTRTLNLYGSCEQAADAEAAGKGLAAATNAYHDVYESALRECRDYVATHPNALAQQFRYTPSQADPDNYQQQMLQYMRAAVMSPSFYDAKVDCANAALMRTNMVMNDPKFQASPAGNQQQILNVAYQSVYQSCLNQAVHAHGG